MVTPPMPKAPGRRPTNEGRAAAPIHPDICAPGTSRSGAIILAVMFVGCLLEIAWYACG